MKEETGRHRAGRVAALLVFSSCILLPPSFVRAIGTQEEVLRGINESVGGQVDGGKLLAGFLVVIGIIILIAIVNQARKRTVTPRALNHPGKLLKEITKATNLKPAEMKQLKMLAESQEVVSPLVLLLCPSIMNKALKQKNEKIDKKVMAGLLKKASISSGPSPLKPTPAAVATVARR